MAQDKVTIQLELKDEKKFRQGLTEARKGIDNLGRGAAGAMRSLGGVINQVPVLGRVVGGVTRQIGSFTSGFMDARAAASSFSGRMGTLGGVARSAVRPLESIGRSIPGTLASASSAVQAFGTRMQSTMAQASASVSGLGGRLVGLAAAVGAASLGTAGVKMGMQFDSVERALTGMYSSGEDAADMMERIKRLGKSSPMDPQAFIANAQNLAYMGIKGEQAEKTLKNVSSAALVAGTGTQGMNSAFLGLLNAVNSGKVQLDHLNMISGAGVPIYSALAQKFGVSAEAFKQMVSDGKVQVKDLQEVLEGGSGDLFQTMITAADEAAGSFSNQMKIMANSANITIGGWLQPAFASLGNSMKGAGPAIESGLASVNDGIARVGEVFTQYDIPNKLRNIKDDGIALGKALGPVLAGAVAGAVGAFVAFVTVLEPVVGALRSLVEAIPEGVLQALGVGLGAIATVGYTAKGGLMVFGVALKLMGPLTLGWAAATKVLAGAMKLLGLAMKLNPIGLIVMAIVALVAGFVLAYKKSETFRNAVHGVLNAIKDAGLAVWDFIKAAGQLLGGAAVKAWGAIQVGAKAVWSALSAVGRVIGTVIVGALKGAWAVLSAIGRFLWPFLNFFIQLGMLIGSVVVVAFQFLAGVAIGFYHSAILPIWNAIKAVASVIWSALVVALSKVRDFFVWIWQVTQPVRDTIVRIAQAQWSMFLTALRWIRDAFLWVGTQARIAWEVIQPIAEMMWENFLLALGKVRDFFVWIWEQAQPVRDVVKNLIETHWDSFTNGLASVRDFFKGIYEWIQKAADKFGELRGSVSSFNGAGGAGKGLGSNAGAGAVRGVLSAFGLGFAAPGAATGGVVRKGGQVVVGERGPEVLEMPAGAAVRPLTEDEKLSPSDVGGTQVTFNISAIDLMEGRRLAELVVNEVQNMAARA